MNEVFPGIFKITEMGVFPVFKPPVNVYVITGKNGLVFDAGYGNKTCLKKFIREFREIEKICIDRGEPFCINRVLLSHGHPDHFAGLRKIRERLGLKIIVSTGMRDIISSSSKYRESYDNYFKDVATVKKRIKHLVYMLLNNLEFFLYSLYWGISYVDDPDVVIETDTTIDINGEQWEIFNSPGHSSEHITLYNSKEGILFSGDNILEGINVWLGPPKSDLDQYEKSLLRILKINALKIIFPAHGNPLLKPYERIREILEWRKKRTDDVHDLLKKMHNTGLSVKETASYLYPSDSRIKKSFAEGWIELTLDKLVNSGYAEKINNRYWYKKLD